MASSRTGIIVPRRRLLLFLWAMSLVLLIRRSSAFVVRRRNVRLLGAERQSASPTFLCKSALFRNGPWTATTARSSFRLSSTSAAAVIDVMDEDIEKTSFIADPSCNNRCFQVTAKYEPAGDQPLAIEQLTKQLQEGDRFNILQGITGTGKTFVLSHVIANINKPTLLLCHNKTLAAQLARELRSFLSNNRVELFVSYYNHYVPESYVETTNTYIAKKSSVNDEIDALRHCATRALLQQSDVIVVASVSCIYGLGLPSDYLQASKRFTTGDQVDLDEFVRQLTQEMLYTQPENDDDMLRGNFVYRHSSDDTCIVTLWPPHEHFPVRIELRPDQASSSSLYQIHSIQQANSQRELSSLDSLHIFPAKHHVMAEDRMEEACLRIEEELDERLKELRGIGKLVEAQRLQQRVLNDLLLLRETGFCSGIENYSRHMAGRGEGEPPDTLLDYMKLASQGDWLLVVDESHVTLPQLRAMYAGDRARKLRLVKHGYRLPSALDNRPLRDDEFWKQVSQAIFLSATPSKQELEWTERDPVHMTIRPTFVCDPVIHVRPPREQLEDLLREIRERADRDERTLALALTKRDAEDLASYLIEQEVNATYIHSGLTTHERADALKALQRGDIDCLVGVNLLREGLDLPQVSLVAILNADSEGFLRSETALLQTVGRAARNINGTAVFYADRITDSMQRCIDSTRNRRERQLLYNEKFGFTSRSTKGSTMMSIFDLLKDQIQNEQPLEIFDPRSNGSSKGNPRKVVTVALPPGVDSSAVVVSDHLPSKPGIYIWKDQEGNILYIGKAKKLRSRVKSYLTPGAKHSPRIRAMLEKASSVDFTLTPSDRDALVLESNLIKHHQPPYNVLLKDDEQYPYICATLGEKYPRFVAVPRRQTGEKASKYRYFGPYPHWNEVNTVLQSVEEKYDLRAESFAARHGTGSKTAYIELFSRALREVFESTSGSLPAMRSEFEEANLLFDSVYNKCRDVIAVGRADDDGKRAIVQVIQLRNGLVAGRFSYTCQVPAGLSDDDMSAIIQEVLERQHYPSGESAPGNRFSFFPDEILVQLPLADTRGLRSSLRSLRESVEPVRVGDKISIRTPAKRGPRKVTDERAMSFAIANANQTASDELLDSRGVAKTSVDGTALDELRTLLSLQERPSRIECYDISHTQGVGAVGSRVVFVDGKPAKHLYRRFNIRTVEGVDDYKSIAEVLERRFRRLSDGSDPIDDAWSLPDLIVIDGGVGQLGAAVKGMARVGVAPRLLQHNQPNGADSEIVEEDAFVGPPEAYYQNDTLVESNQHVRASVPVVALAKENEDLYLHGMRRPVNEAPDSPALLLLRALRDESHRFALDSHRRRRSVRNTRI